MMRAAIVLLVFLASSPESIPGDSEPAALVRELSEQPQRDVPPAMLIGAWRGSPGGHGDVLEVIFSNDIRPATVVAHFTFVDNGATQTIRRLGRLTRTSVQFAVVGGGHIVLTFVGANRLVGEFVGGGAPAPPAPVHGVAMELFRLRPR